MDLLPQSGSPVARLSRYIAWDMGSFRLRTLTFTSSPVKKADEQLLLPNLSRTGTPQSTLTPELIKTDQRHTDSY